LAFLLSFSFRRFWFRKTSGGFQADTFKQVVESLGDGQIELVQLRDLVPGEPGVGRERF